MVRLLSVILLSVFLSACAAPPGWSGFASRPGPGRATSAAKPFSFEWRLSGDRAVAPLQVFDNGLRIWLQFAPGQALPAIFARTAQGDVPVSPVIEGAYAILPSVWPEIILRGGRLVAHAHRNVQAAASPPAAGSPTASQMLTAPSADAPSSTPVARHAQVLPARHYPAVADAAAGSPAADFVSPASTTLANVGVNYPAPPAAVKQAIVHTAHTSALLDAKEAATPTPSGEPAAPSAAFSVSAQDRNFRTALARWSGLAGWTFQPEHWAVDVDIPISGSASFDTEFKPAVRSLIAATELSERPLQPCFYANRVLRIVAYAQPCDRAAQSGPAS